MRVLVVDDEPYVTQALCRALSLPEGGGYCVESCMSGEDALVRLRERHFDLLITDLRMPGMSGLALLECLHGVSPSTRSILITAFGSLEVESESNRLADAYLPKPFGLGEFVQVVRRILCAN